MSLKATTQDTVTPTKAKSRPKRKRKKAAPQSNGLRERLIQYLPIWLILGALGIMLLPGLLDTTTQIIEQVVVHLEPLLGSYLPILLLVGAALSLWIPAARAATFRLIWQALGWVLGLARDFVVHNPRLALGLAGVALLAAFAPPVMNRLFRPVYNGTLAPLFTSQVQYWARDITRWALQYGLDPNLLATVMQIESCGHPTVISYAGAQGLMQVMPFHFVEGENTLDPDTNMQHGAAVLRDCMDRANGDVGLAMACYNGGPSVIEMPNAAWNEQAQRYYIWGTGIYQEASNQQVSGATLNRWLDAGGNSLCYQAANTLGIE